MVSLIEFWVPIVVAASLVFVASSMIHMALKWHNGDYKAVPGEADVVAAMRGASLGPGAYMFPGCADMKQMGSPEMQAKYEAGPVGWMTIMPDSIRKGYAWSVTLKFIADGVIYALVTAGVFAWLWPDIADLV